MSGRPILTTCSWLQVCVDLKQSARPCEALCLSCRWLKAMCDTVKHQTPQGTGMQRLSAEASNNGSASSQPCASCVSECGLAELSCFVVGMLIMCCNL